MSDVLESNQNHLSFYMETHPHSASTILIFAGSLAANTIASSISRLMRQKEEINSE